MCLLLLWHMSVRMSRSHCRSAGFLGIISPVISRVFCLPFAFQKVMPQRWVSSQTWGTLGIPPPGTPGTSGIPPSPRASLKSSPLPKQCPRAISKIYVPDPNLTTLWKSYSERLMKKWLEPPETDANMKWERRLNGASWSQVIDSSVRQCVFQDTTK